MTTGPGSRRTWLALGAVAIAAGAGLSAWQLGRIRATTAADDEAVKLFFAQTLPDAAGEVFRFEQLRGKPVVINFWATWCPPCIEEMPELSALQLEMGTDRVRFVGVGVDSPESVARFSQRFPVSYPLVVANATGAFLAAKFGNSASALPYTVVLDSDGRVHTRILGRVHMDSLRKVLKSPDLH